MSVAVGTVNGRRREYVDNDIAQLNGNDEPATSILKICDNFFPTIVGDFRRFKSPSADYYSCTCDCSRDKEKSGGMYDYCEIYTTKSNKSQRKLIRPHRQLRWLAEIVRDRWNIIVMHLTRIIFYVILLIRYLLPQRILFRAISTHYKTAQIIIGYFFVQLLPDAEACSTRPSPKPRPPRPIWSPEVDSSLQRQNCSEDYVNLFCLNDGKCFATKFYDSLALGCECVPGYYGHRCEYVDFGVLPVQQRIETASIAGGVTVLVILLVFTSFIVYVYRRRSKIRASGRHASPSIFDEPDQRAGTGANNLPVRPFSIRRVPTLVDPCTVHMKNEIFSEVVLAAPNPNDGLSNLNMNSKSREEPRLK